MSVIVLYLVICALGVVVAWPLRRVAVRMGFLDTAQTVAVFCLVFTMGARIGANDEVVRSLPVYGVYAVLITLAVLAASVLMVTLLRRGMGLDRYGHRKGAAFSQTMQKDDGNPPEISYRMTLYILAFVALGILCGLFLFRSLFPDYQRFNDLAGTAITVELSTLLFFVGLSLGLKQGLWGEIKAVGLRMLAIPAATLVGTLLASALMGWLLPIGVKDGLVIGAGLGWYSLAPGMIMDTGNMTAGAISFLHNVMRELFSIVLIPLVAQKVGFVETVGMPGAAAMDSSLPIVVRATSPDMAVYSFLSGLVLTLVVPVLVPVFF